MNSARRELAWVSVILTAIGIWCSCRGVYEPDLGWHLAQGRLLAGGELIRTNALSSTWPSAPQAYVPWLFDLIAFQLVEHAGEWSLCAAIALLLATALMTTWARMRQLGVQRGAAVAVMALVVLVVAPRVLPRPHMVSLLGLAVTLWLIERSRQRGHVSALRPLPLVMVLWSQFHVEVLFGVALTGLHSLAETIQPTTLGHTRRDKAHLWLITLAGAVGTLLTPYGPGLWRYLHENSLVPQLIRIAELLAPTLPSYAAFFLFGAITLIMLSVHARVGLYELAVALFLGWLSLRHVRFTALFAVAVAPFVARALSETVAAAWLRKGLLLLTVFSLPYCTEMVAPLIHPFAARIFPPQFFSAAGVKFIQTAGLQGPLFNSMNLGGYLSWAVPGAGVFQDSRLQAYPPEHFQNIMSAWRQQPSWDRLVQEVDWAVVSRPRANDLSGSGRFQRTEWATVFWDDAFEVFVRRTGRFQSVAERFEYNLVLPEMAELPPGPQASAEAQRHVIEHPGHLPSWQLLCREGDFIACGQVEFLRFRPGH